MDKLGFTFASNWFKNSMCPVKIRRSWNRRSMIDPRRYRQAMSLRWPFAGLASSAHATSGSQSRAIGDPLLEMSRDGGYRELIIRGYLEDALSVTVVLSPWPAQGSIFATMFGG